MENLKKSWDLWKFFPAKLNSFYYNTTLASIYWNLDKDSANDLWFLWKEDKTEKEWHIPIKEEQEFLEKHNLEIPKIHWEKKIKEHFS